VKTTSLADAAASAAANVRILFLGLLIAASGDSHAAHAAMTLASPVTADNLSVSSAWGRATPPGVATGVAYFTIVNRGRQADTLVSISSPASISAELHRTTVQNGLSTMRPAGQVVIAPGQTMKAEPGGLHVMLKELKHPLAAGSRVPLLLNFRAAGAITVQVEVLPLAPASQNGNAGH
jgi:copper(I)-binding protein